MGSTTSDRNRRNPSFVVFSDDEDDDDTKKLAKPEPKNKELEPEPSQPHHYMAHVPDDIMSAILSQIPWKSISRLQCVSLYCSVILFRFFFNSVIHLGIAILKFDFEHRSVIHLRGFGTLRLLRSEFGDSSRIAISKFDFEHSSVIYLRGFGTLRLLRSETLEFSNSNDVVVSGLTSLNSQMFHIVINSCNNVKLQGVTTRKFQGH